jgi:RNA polymerase sigma-70 factor (ECF subfamily)
LGAYDDAEDAVQETLIQLFQSLPTARHDLPFRPWFYRILRRKCLDSLRRRKPLLRWSDTGDDDEVDGSLPDSLADPATLPEELFERRDLQRLLHEAINELPPRYREVVLLRYVSDLTFEEMAATLSTPVNTVKTRFQRAKQRLRPLLAARHVGHS